MTINAFWSLVRGFGRSCTLFVLTSSLKIFCFSLRLDIVGNVHFVERDFRVSFAFPAFSQTVSFLHVVKERNVLVTIGEESEEALVPTLKLWDLAKIEREGEPELLSVIKLSKAFPVRQSIITFS